VRGGGASSLDRSLCVLSRGSLCDVMPRERRGGCDADRLQADRLQVNSRTHVNRQKLTGSISPFTNPVSVLSVPIQTAQPLKPLYMYGVCLVLHGLSKPLLN
jgi:hypothetical protein